MYFLTEHIHFVSSLRPVQNSQNIKEIKENDKQAVSIDEH
jgi:hypothetical protein